MQAQTLQARAIRPRTGSADRRRIAAAFLSALYPGLGQAFNRDLRSVLLFALPLTALAVLTLVLLQAFGPGLFVTFFNPDTVVAILVLNALLLGWRLIAIGHAWVAGSRGPVGKVGVVGLLLVSTLALLPQVYGGLLAYRFYQTTIAVCISCVRFQPSGDQSQQARPTSRPLFTGDDQGGVAGPTPERAGRTNILLLGIDSRPSRDHALADSIIVASIDPVGKTVSMLSIPRDLVDIPLPNGKTYGRKINTLMGYVNGHPDDPDFAFAQRSGTRALQDAVGELLGIPIHYYAKVDLPGFVRVIDALGGVDIDVKKAVHAPGYSDFGVAGFVVEPGVHHFDGRHALAYARIRRAAGESDFTRAARQQEVLIAVRNAALHGGAIGLLSRVDGLLSAVEGAIRTDVPLERFGDFAFLAEQIEAKKVTNVVLLDPLFKARMESGRGYVQIPDVEAIRAMARELFPAPGTDPQAWPVPSPGPDEGGG